MHPDIKAFWEHKGKKITALSSPSVEIYYEGLSFESMAPPFLFF